MLKLTCVELCNLINHHVAYGNTKRARLFIVEAIKRGFMSRKQGASILCL